MKIDELEECFRILVAYARNMDLSCDADADLYWSVSSQDEWLNVNDDPVLGVGSLVDDVAELRKLLTEPNRATSLDLVRFGAVLRLLSQGYRK